MKVKVKDLPFHKVNVDFGKMSLKTILMAVFIFLLFSSLCISYSHTREMKNRKWYQKEIENKNVFYSTILPWPRPWNQKLRVIIIFEFNESYLNR